MAVVVNFQIAVVEVKLEAKSVKAVLSARKNHCSTTGQPFDSANSINVIQILSQLILFFVK